MNRENGTIEITPLSRNEVVAAIERTGPPRVPLVRAKWWGEGLAKYHGEALAQFDRYPEDVVQVFVPNPVDPGRMDLSWQWDSGGAHDARIVIDDWAKLDEFVEKLPDPATDEALDRVGDTVTTAHAENRYVLFSFWNLFFERPWMLRGMENLLTDYYLHPDEIHRLHDAMARTYCTFLAEAHRRFAPDGFFTSDDLGHQYGPMMSPEIFHEYHFPYYSRVGAATRELDMHFWLHSCGDNTELLPDLIASGVHIFHPVQKHTMDEERVAEQYGADLTFLAGIDVQHVLQEVAPEEVRREVRFLIDTFDRDGGGMLIGAGNGILPGTPLENIDAFLDEACRYGSAHRSAVTPH